VLLVQFFFCGLRRGFLIKMSNLFRSCDFLTSLVSRPTHRVNIREANDIIKMYLLTVSYSATEVIEYFC